MDQLQSAVDQLKMAYLQSLIGQSLPQPISGPISSGGFTRNLDHRSVSAGYMPVSPSAPVSPLKNQAESIRATEAAFFERHKRSSLDQSQRSEVVKAFLKCFGLERFVLVPTIDLPDITCATLRLNQLEVSPFWLKSFADYLQVELVQIFDWVLAHTEVEPLAHLRILKGLSDFSQGIERISWAAYGLDDQAFSASRIAVMYRHPLALLRIRLMGLEVILRSFQSEQPNLLKAFLRKPLVQFAYYGQHGLLLTSRGRPVFVNLPTYWFKADDYRLHSETGPAIGWCPVGLPERGSFFIRGVPIPYPEAVVAPELLTIGQILSESNQDVRVILIERYGWEKFLFKVGVKPLDAVMVQAGPSSWIEELVSVFEFVNGNVLISYDPSTGRKVFLVVPVDCRSCLDAQRFLMASSEMLAGLGSEMQQLGFHATRSAYPLVRV